MNGLPFHANILQNVTIVTAPFDISRFRNFEKRRRRRGIKKAFIIKNKIKRIHKITKHIALHIRFMGLLYGSANEYIRKQTNPRD